MDVAGFLKRFPPFDSLDAATLGRVAGSIQIEFIPAGTVILRQSAEPAAFLYVVRSGAVEVRDEDALLDLLGEGEVFGQFSLLSGLGPNSTVRTHEDTICYLIDRDLAEEALGTPGGLAFVTTSAARRLTAAGEARASHTGLGRDTVDVGSLIARAPVTCESDTPVGDAARLMAEQHVSALLVPGHGGWGILTDRDLRTRVLAVGRAPATPVSEVMSHPARTVPAETMAAEVLLAMLEGGFHHFPVVDPEGRIMGVVTDTDLMGIGRDSPFALKSAIERARDEGEAIAAAGRIPQAVAALVESGAEPVGIGHIVGVTIDGLTRRLIQLAIDRLGEPPTAWAWLALGSAARHEQALRTDQDHALAFGPGDLPPDRVDAYFADMAEAVTGGLERAGIPRCAGDAMAVNPALRRSVDGWVEAFNGWMSDPGIGGSIQTSIVFDYRRVAGPLEVEPALDAVIRTAAAHPQFLRHLSRRALDLRPPTGFFRDLVVEAKGDHAGTLDIKHGGITLIGNLARASCIGAGIVERQTLRRLRAAESAGRLDHESAESLGDAFRLLWEVRLEHQTRCVREGRSPDDFVDPKTLGPVARRGLKESFRIIARQQKVLAADLGVALR